MHNNSIWKSFLACFTHLDNCPPLVEEGTPLGAPLRRRERDAVCPSFPLTRSLIMQLLLLLENPKIKNLIFSTKRYASLACVTATQWEEKEGALRGKLISGTFVALVARRCASSLSPGANELQHSVRYCCHRRVEYLSDTCRAELQHACYD